MHRNTHHSLHKRRRFHKRKPLGPDGSALLQHIGNKHVPVPERLSAMVRFAGAPVNLVGASGPFKSYSANGPYDPDPSLGGVTSAYFTELGLAYTNYVCYGSKIKVYITPNAVPDSPPVVAVIPCRSTSTGSLQVPTDFQAMIATPGAKWMYCDYNYKPLTVVHNYVSIKSYYNEIAEGDQGWSGEAPGDLKTLESGSNPSNTIYWVIGVYNVDNITTDANVWISAEIDYYVTFSSRTCPIGYNNNSLTVEIDPAKPGNEVISKPEPPKEDITESVMIGKILDKIRGK